MKSAPTLLEEPYRGRAVAPGTPSYWSWLFAARAVRAPLVGVYALKAEWRALTDPATDPAVAHLKLTWWREEVQRLSAGTPLHPISRYLSQLPRAQAEIFAALDTSVSAAIAQVAGAPLERSSELEGHADALLGIPLTVAARLAGVGGADRGAMHRGTTALAAAQYLARAIADYGRDSRIGRVAFPVDELLAAGIENDDLAAPNAPPRLQDYLNQLRGRAATFFRDAADELATVAQPELRHLGVLAVLGLKRLDAGESPSSADFRLADLYNAWKAARRTAATR